MTDSQKEALRILVVAASAQAENLASYGRNGSAGATREAILINKSIGKLVDMMNNVPEREE